MWPESTISGQLLVHLRDVIAADNSIANTSITNCGEDLRKKESVRWKTSGR